jgi:hydrogenase nickel incorporation protein HypA/HybF
VHELRVCRSLVSLAVAECDRAGGRRIVALDVEVGELSGVAAQALAFAFPFCAEGTPAEGARLRIDRSPGRELRLRELEVA